MSSRSEGRGAAVTGFFGTGRVVADAASGDVLPWLTLRTTTLAAMKYPPLWRKVTVSGRPLSW
ncbi:hypothetical protein [Marinobacter segnicrescens]|uniref:hypothetical protein n=1 Tax=Marinobacter segnicrescens TaxID=430453 RepID=UPI00115FB9DE|nr:hypothetical protein [Marinobacter segnicrescens]